MVDDGEGDNEGDIEADGDSEDNMDDESDGDNEGDGNVKEIVEGKRGSKPGVDTVINDTVLGPEFNGMSNSATLEVVDIVRENVEVSCSKPLVTLAVERLVVLGETTNEVALAAVVVEVL